MGDISLRIRYSSILLVLVQQTLHSSALVTDNLSSEAPSASWL